jgi:hypothetical protein
VTVPAWIHAVLTVVWLGCMIALVVAGEASGALLTGALVVLQGSYAAWIHHHNGWTG